MTHQQPDELFDPQKGRPAPDAQGTGDVAAGTDAHGAPPSTGDSPTEGTVPGPLAPQPAPDEPLRPHPEND